MRSQHGETKVKIMVEIIDGVESIVVSIGSEKRKKLATKLGMERVQLNQILHAGSLAKAPRNLTKDEIEEYDKGLAALTPRQRKAYEDSMTVQRKIKSAVNGKPNNKNHVVGDVDKPIEQKIQIAMGVKKKTTVNATTYGLVSAYLSPFSTKHYLVGLAPIGLVMLSPEHKLTKSRANSLAKELAKLDWGDGKTKNISKKTEKEARQIMSKYRDKKLDERDKKLAEEDT